jgi:predicted small secreted protein
MIKKKITMVASMLAVATILSACNQADVIGKTAITSFDKVLEARKEQVTFDENKNSWVMEAPTGEYFEYSKDFGGNLPDAVVEFDAAPFVGAGLDISKLSTNQYVYDATTDRIRMIFEKSQDSFQYKEDATALNTFEKIVETNRDSIGYHADLDHYGIALGDGNMFEWAKDMSKNDKDIVFVLNPQPFIDAGVDPNNVEGWVFAKVKVDQDGKMVEVDKLLKPFDLN